jgi:hypothetical protein
MADDDLAYGDYHGQGGEGEETDRGFLGDTYRRFTGRKPQDQGQQPVRNPSYAYSPYPQIPKNPLYFANTFNCFELEHNPNLSTTTIQSTSSTVVESILLLYLESATPYFLFRRRHVVHL